MLSSGFRLEKMQGEGFEPSKAHRPRSGSRKYLEFVSRHALSQQISYPAIEIGTNEILSLARLTVAISLGKLRYPCERLYS